MIEFSGHSITVLEKLKEHNPSYFDAHACSETGQERSQVFWSADLFLSVLTTILFKLTFLCLA